MSKIYKKKLFTFIDNICFGNGLYTWLDFVNVSFFWLILGYLICTMDVDSNPKSIELGFVKVNVYVIL
jgi:hypothetical protein